jgi:regulator of replication initiation timing
LDIERMMYVDSKDIPIEEVGSSENQFVEELIYENIDLMNENVQLIIENKELRKKVRNLETLYRIACLKNINRRF